MDNRILRKMGIGKPNMAALEGELGRQIMTTIRSTPPLDREKLRVECEAIKHQWEIDRLNHDSEKLEEDHEPFILY